jgi:hypothetical protein
MTTPSSRRAIGGVVASLLGAVAVDQGRKLADYMIERRKILRAPSEAVYRDLVKLRLVGEAALTLDKESSSVERQRRVVESTNLRDRLHEQLADWRLSSAAQRSDLLGAAQTAVDEADRLVAVLNKWALHPSDADQTKALQQAVQAVAASANALISGMEKAQRGRLRRGEKGDTSNDKPRRQRRTGTS